MTVTVNETTQVVQIAAPGPAGIGVPTGGSSGQVLAKASGTNYDTAWISAGSGSVTGVLATSPIVSDGDATTPTISHATTLEAPTTQTFPTSISVNASGHITAIAGAVDAATMRGALGLKTAAVLDVGTSASQVVQLDGTARLPAVDGSQITAIDAGNISSGTLSISRGGTGSATAPLVGVITAADAPAARTVLGLGTAATSATGDFLAASAATAFGLSLIDDLDAATARNTLGLGTAATSNTGDFAATLHTHSLSQITDAGTAAASSTSDFEASGAVSSHAAVTSGVHGISSYGATLVDDADAATARTTLGLGTAATSATGDFEASGAVSTHAALTSGVHGISSYGATLVDDADAATARTTLGLGTLATASTITDSYLILIETPSDKTYVLDGRVAAARTVTNFYAKTSSGTCTATLKNLTDATTIGTISVTSTGGSAASLSNTGLTANERIAIEISSNSSSADLEMVVDYSQ